MGLVTPELGTFIWMFLAFAIVLVILRLFAWKPILEALKEREDSIDQALKAAENAKLEMAELQADNQRILKEARFEREQMLKEAKEISDKIINESKQKATIEGDKMLEAARLNIQSEKNAAISDIKAQLAVLSIDIAEKILRIKLDDNQQQQDYFKKIINEVKLN